MQYTSTRNNRLSVTASFAIANGISPEGGLYVPQRIPTVDEGWIRRLTKMEYPERASRVLSKFLTDFSAEELSEAVEGAYANGTFEEDWAAPLADLSDGRYVLELWHGPTCAFKDMALQLLPRLLVPAAKRALDGKQILILVATSGDTGKAALEGFRDVDGVKIADFYPDGGVSPMQYRQMATQEGGNVAVYAIEGNFDDAQTNVKRIFTDAAVIDRLAKENTVLSSANSINWGRLVPQIVYYFSAYADLVASGDLPMGEKINFVVPTGNFGNILAGYYAMQMGLPVNKLICASNCNNVLTDFIRDGVYDANRAFYSSLSPSMDILISSNLERLLFELTGRDSDAVQAMMDKLSTDRRYEIPKEMHDRLTDVFWGGYLSDEDCKARIHDACYRTGYLCDPHTAVAMGVYEEYKRTTGDKTKTVIVSTASPYKFCKTVLSAIGRPVPEDEFEAAKALSDFTLTDIPQAITALEKKAIRFERVIAPAAMADEIVTFAAK
jgi:threonine synthase